MPSDRDAGFGRPEVSSTTRLLVKPPGRVLQCRNTRLSVRRKRPGAAVRGHPHRLARAGAGALADGRLTPRRRHTKCGATTRSRRSLSPGVEYSTPGDYVRVRRYSCAPVVST